MSKISNMEKYGNYKEQMGRLRKALDNHFLLEALFIEYAIMEDRCESLLRHSGKTVNPKASISQKVEKIEKLLNQGNLTLDKYISNDLLREILNWKDDRNRLIHALMNQSLTSEELEQLAAQGQQIVKTLCSKTTSYKRALGREKESNRRFEYGTV